MTLKQFVCGLTRHSPITRNRGGRRFSACFACDRELSPGWDLRDTRHRRLTNHEDGVERTPMVSRVAQVKV
jgi:hypothetical protein